MKRIIEKIPQKQEIIQLSSVIVFINFSWSIGRMFWFLPAWILFMSFNDLLPIFAYTLAVALLESLLVLGVILSIVVFLPEKFFKQNFLAQSVIMVLFITIITFLVQMNLGPIATLTPRKITVLLPIILVLLLAMVTVISYLLVKFISALGKLMVNISERMQVFFYIYLPLGIISFIIIILRNIS